MESDEKTTLSENVELRVINDENNEKQIINENTNEQINISNEQTNNDKDEKIDINEGFNDKTNKKSKAGLFIILAVVLVLIIIGLFGFIYFNRTFKVTFDYNNEGENYIIDIKYSDIIDQKHVRGKKELGDLFNNWYEVIDGKTSNKPFDFNNKITANVYLKAIYDEEKTITITFDSKGGTDVESVTYDKGLELVLPEAPTREHYQFMGWEDEKQNPVLEGAILTGSTELFAKWEKKAEVLDLSLSEPIVHPNGKINTTTAVVKIENTSDKATLSLDNDVCATIDNETGVIALRNLSGKDKEDCFVNGKTIKVTATLPSGLTKTASFEIERLLVLKNEDLTLENENQMAIENDFNVTSSLSVTWETSVAEGNTYKGLKDKTSNNLTGTLKCEDSTGEITCSFVNIIATTKAGQIVKTTLVAK